MPPSSHQADLLSDHSGAASGAVPAASSGTAGAAPRADLMDGFQTSFSAGGPTAAPERHVEHISDDFFSGGAFASSATATASATAPPGASASAGRRPTAPAKDLMADLHDVDTSAHQHLYKVVEGARVYVSV